MKNTRMRGLILLLIALLLNGQIGHAFEFNGFADVSLNKSTEDATGEARNSNFAFGSLDFYIAESVEDINVIVELIVEDGYILDLERLSLGYTFNDLLMLRVGRFHTPLGIWNKSYHHGVQLQPTIRRPEFIEFEDDGGILPVHIIGAYVSGRTNTSAGAFEYDAIYGNGSKITSKDGDGTMLDPNNVSDDNNNKAVALNATFSPSAIKGFKVGVSGYSAKVQSDESTLPTTVKVDQTILGFDVTYAINNISLSGEYFSIKNTDDATDENYTNTAYYGLITYTIKDKWVPYLMYEDMIVKKADPYIAAFDTEDTKATAVGLRYNINYRSSLKGEYRMVTSDHVDWNEYAAQWAIVF